MAITFDASQPAWSDRAVVFACDGRYLPFALLAADRLAALHPAREFDICLCALDEMLVVPESLAGLGLRVCRIETGGVLSGLPTDARRTEAAYLRLALPAAFGHEYHRLLYLDSDVFPQGGDWQALLSLDLGGRAIGAVRDNLQWRRPRRRPKQFVELNLGEAPYLNSGLLLIDIEDFLAQDVLGRCLALAQARPDKLVGLDQELLNAVLHGDWAELSPLWNWQYTRSSMLFEAMETAHLVHFIGGKKPWDHTEGALPVKFHDAYKRFFHRHLPDLAPLGDALPPHRNRHYLWWMLFRHLRVVGRTSDYLDRFPIDLTVVSDPAFPIGGGRPVTALG